MPRNSGGNPMPSILQSDVLYTADETAWYLRISQRTLERWRTDGRGPRVTRFRDDGRPYYQGRHIFEAINNSQEPELVSFRAIKAEYTISHSVMTRLKELRRDCSKLNGRQSDG
jgi:hypothetical protein